jgi:hypothetical protein
MRIDCAASRQRAISSASTPSRAAARVPGGHVGGERRFSCGHQVGVDVVVDDRGVLVRAGDAVDAELARRVVVAQRAPQPRGCDEQLEADLALELVSPVAHVAAHGVGDVGVDVERARAGRPVAEHSWPRIVRHGNARALRPSCSARSWASGRIDWRQRSASAAASGQVAEHRQAERLGVPEGVPS